MPVAEVPGKPDQMLRIAASDFKERLGRSHHLDQPAIFEHQRVATAQDDRSFQIEQDAVGRWLAPAMLSQNLRGSDHRKMPREAARRKASM